MMEESELKKILIIAMLLSLSIVLQIIEGLFPIPFIIPGVKLGLANIITVIVLYRYGFKDALIIGVLRVFIAAILRNGFGINFLFSLIGAITSIIIMHIFKEKTKMTMIGISIVGSNFHILSQIIMATIIYRTNIFYVTHLPIMLTISILTGLIIGKIAKKIYINNYK